MKGLCIDKLYDLILSCLEFITKVWYSLHGTVSHPSQNPFISLILQDRDCIDPTGNLIALTRVIFLVYVLTCDDSVAEGYTII